MSVDLDAARNHVERARALIEVGRNADALLELEAALAADPDSFDAHCLMAAVLLDLGRPADSLKAAARAVQADPEDERPHEITAYAFIRMKKGEQALTAALEAQRLEPESPAAAIAVGAALLECGRAFEAEPVARHAIALAPHSADGYELHGRACMEMKAYPQAEADFREALRLEPDNWVAQNNLGVLLQRMKRKKEAVSAFESAVRTDPRASLPRQNLVGATRAYVGAGSVLLVIIGIRLVVLLAQSTRNQVNWTLVALLVVLITIPIGLWIRSYLRQRALSPTVMSYYRLEAKRNRAISVLYFFYVVAPLIAVLVVILAFAATPYMFTAALVGLIGAGLWYRFYRLVWRRYVLPRLRREDDSDE